MICPKCGSENVSVQMVTDTQLKAGHGLIWWLLVGWWWIPVKWFCFFWLALLAKMFGSKSYKLKTTSHSECVCQSCGHHWTPDRSAPATQTAAASVRPGASARITSAETQRYIAGCEVVGESYHKDAIASLGVIQRDYYWPTDRLYEKFVEGDRIYKYRFEDQDVDLVPEPDNPYDPDAIRVDVNGKQVGYIARDNTQRIRELMDAGARVRAKISAGPCKEISETADGLLASEKTDVDFRVWLSFFGMDQNPVEAPRELPAMEIKKRSPVAAKIAGVITWILLTLSIAAVCVGLIGGVVLGILPEQYVLYVLGAAIVCGILTWILCGVAFA